MLSNAIIEEFFYRSIEQILKRIDKFERAKFGVPYSATTVDRSSWSNDDDTNSYEK